MQIHTVMNFLSRSNSTEQEFDGYEYEGEATHNPPEKESEYLYPSRTYPYPRKYSGTNSSGGVGVGGGYRGGGGGDDKCDNSSSSGMASGHEPGGGGGGGEGEGDVGGEGGECGGMEPGMLLPSSHPRPHGSSMDSGIGNGSRLLERSSCSPPPLPLPPASSSSSSSSILDDLKEGGGDLDRQASSSGHERPSSSQDLTSTLDFSNRGFGQLFPSMESDYAMSMLRDSAGYQLAQELYKQMDSDSEQSSRDSLPPSSSGSASPMLDARARSEEHINLLTSSRSNVSVACVCGVRTYVRTCACYVHVALNLLTSTCSRSNVSVCLHVRE